MVVNQAERENKKDIVIFKGVNGNVTLRGDVGKDTLWATQAEMADVFNVDVRTVNEHLKNIYKTKELQEIATIRKTRIVRKEGNREVGG